MLIFIGVWFFYALRELKFFELQLPDVLVLSDGKSAYHLEVLVIFGVFVVAIVVIIIVVTLLRFLSLLDIKATV